MKSCLMNTYYERGLALTKEAGVVIRDHVKKCRQIETKSGPTDLVTEADKKVEDLLFSSLGRQFPDHKFIGEESTADGGVPVELTDAPTWIIDPIDGTMNFVHGYPNFCVSMALWIKKDPSLAFVYNPITDHLFTALKGKGAFLNGSKISCSQAKSLANCLLIMELCPPHDEKKMETAQANVKTLIPQVHGLRSLGSAALDMSATAAGWADCFVDFGLHVWDLAAGTLLVREAGGVVLDPSGGPLDPLSRRVLCAATQELADAVVPQLKQYYPERD